MKLFLNLVNLLSYRPQLLTGILFLLVLAFPRNVYAADWPTYLGNALRQGTNADTTVSTKTAPVLQPLWQYQTGDVIASQPIVANGIMYVGSWDGNEYAFDQKTGVVKWKTYLGIVKDAACNTPSLGVTSSPTIVGNTMYLGGGDNYWYALDPTSGQILWKVFSGDTSVTSGHYNWSSPLIVNNYAYIGVASDCDTPLVQGQLLQVNLTTHQVVNTFNVVPNGQVGGGIWTTPAYDATNNTVYVTTGTINGTQPYSEAMIGIDATTMQLKEAWQIPQNPNVADADWGTSPLVFTANNVTYVSGINKDGNLYIFKTGSVSNGPVWKYQIAQGGDCPQCGQGSISSGIFANGQLYYAGGITTIGGVLYNGSVRAFNPSTGQVLWEHGDSQTEMSAISQANGVIYAAPGSVFEALNASTGAVLYQAQVSQIIYGAPSVANGKIAMGTADGLVDVFGLPETTISGTKLGGMNLDSYCQTKGSANATLQNSSWSCNPGNQAIFLQNACQWQYNNSSAVVIQERSGDPYSYACYTNATQITPTPTPTNTPTPTPTPTGTVTRLGDMNLDGYCQSIQQNGASLSGSTWTCIPSNSSINLTSACQWQYNPNAYALQDRSGDPYSWACYQNTTVATPTPTPTITPTPTPGTGTRLGGMNLDGYCQSLSQTGATFSGSNWLCVPNNTTINMTSACQWQYVPSSYAKQDRTGDPYSWSCYQ